MTKLRIFLFVFFIVVVAVLIVFPYRNKAGVNIAFLGNLSGNGSHSDISACNGASLAVASVNARGGVKGRQLKLNIYDSKGRPEAMRGIQGRMREKKSDLLLAPYFPEGRLLREVEKDQILPLRFGFSSQDGGRAALGFYPKAKASGAALARLALARGVRSIAVLHDAATYPFGLAFLEGFRDPYQERGGKIEVELTFNSSGSTDLGTLVENAEKTLPGGILVIASVTTTGRLGEMFRKNRPSVALFAAPWALTEALGETANTLEGMSTYAETAGGNVSPVLGAVSSAYEERYGAPADMSAVFGYEAILILAEGIRNSASPDPFLVRHTLEKMFRFKGMVSNYTLGGEDPGENGLVLLEIRGGLVRRSE